MEIFGHFDVRTLGAAGNGTADDTNAIQRAIECAAKVNGVVLIPPGRYLCGKLQLLPGIEIRGSANFSFRNSHGTILQLRDDDSTALLDLTNAYGAKVTGLCLVGRGFQEPKTAHGIIIDKPDYGTQEDAPCIDNCRIENFSGDGIHLERIWCFTIRHCHLFKNGGCGIRVRGWDGFVQDNWMSGNLGAGYGAYEENASVTLTGNRIEWNHAGGIEIHNGSHYNITGNYIDRSGNAGLRLLNANIITATGNIIYRSGKPEWSNGIASDSCHLKMENCNGVSCCSNSLTCGKDDGGKGEMSPQIGIFIKNCNSCTVSLNTLHNGAIKTLLECDGSRNYCIIKDNPGKLLQ